MKKKFFLLLFHIILPLIAGLLAYLIYRNNTLLHRYLPSHFYSPAAGRFNLFMANHFPDFCWTYSLASALVIWEKESGIRIRYFFAWLVLTISMTEILQIFIPLLFTFDMVDLAAAVISVCLSWFLLNLFYDKKV